MDKKEMERRILAFVYKKDAYSQILDSEEPDFRIRRHSENDYFGVEVTTFHYSESYARLRNIPDYFDEIIGDGKYRHRVDRRELESHDVTIYDAEGNEKSRTKALLRPKPKIEEHVAMLTNVISRKNAKLTQYQKDLTHINLIIFDTESGFLMYGKGEYFKSLFTQDLKELLFKTGFHEIFLVTILADRWVYVPLKMVLLVGEWYLFHTLIYKHFPEKGGRYRHEFMTLFAQYLQYKTGNAFYRREKRYEVEVIWANTGVLWTDPTNTIRDHADYPTPSDVIRPSLKGVKRLFKSQDFQTKLGEVSRDYTFSTEIAYDVNEPVTILQGRMKTVIASEIPRD